MVAGESSGARRPRALGRASPQHHKQGWALKGFRGEAEDGHRAGFMGDAWTEPSLFPVAAFCSSPALCPAFAGPQGHGQGTQGCRWLAPGMHQPGAELCQELRLDPPACCRCDTHGLVPGSPLATAGMYVCPRAVLAVLQLLDASTAWLLGRRRRKKKEEEGSMAPLCSCSPMPQRGTRRARSGLGIAGGVLGHWGHLSAPAAGLGDPKAELLLLAL